MSEIETVFNYCGVGGDGYFSSTEGKFIRRVMQLKEQYPNQVDIISKPEENGGCVYVKMPRSWLKIAPPRKIELSDEEVAKRRERLIQARTRHKAAEDAETGTADAEMGTASAETETADAETGTKGGDDRV